MYKKQILFGTLIAVLLMLVTPCISAVNSNIIKDEISSIASNDDGKIRFIDRIKLLGLGIGAIIESLIMVLSGSIGPATFMFFSGLYLIIVAILGRGIKDIPDGINSI